MLNERQFSIEDQDIHDPNRYVARPHFPERGVMDTSPNVQGKLIEDKPYKYGYGRARDRRVIGALEQVGGIRVHPDDFDEDTLRDILHGIKRSTIPAEHIASLGGISVQDKPDLKVAGLYMGWPHEKIIINQAHAGTIEGAEHTFAHEMGHHIGYATNPREQEEMQATREGHADVYASRHTPQVRWSAAQQYDKASVESLARQRGESPHESSIKYVQALQEHNVEPHPSFNDTIDAARARTEIERVNNQPPLQQGRLF